MERPGGEEGWTLEQLRDAIVPPSGLRTCRGPALYGLLAATIDAVGLGPFGPQARTPSFLRAFEVVLDELALGSVSSATLAEAAERLGTAGARLTHLARLADDATGRMARAGVELAASRWVAASSVLTHGWPADLAFRQLELTVAPPFPPAVVGFLAALARVASSTGRTLALRVPLTGDAGIDAALEPLLQAFEAGPDLPGIELLPELAEGPLSEPVRRLTAAPQGSLSTDALEAVVAPGARREAAALVDALRRALEAGASFDRCAFAVMAADDAPELERALQEAGIPVARRPPVPLPTTSAGRVGLLWAGLAARGASAEDVAWLLKQRLLPALRVERRLDPLPLLRRAGVRDKALGAQGDDSAYQVRLSAFAGRRREAGDLRDADAAEGLLRAATALLALAERIPRRGRLADLLEAWRGGLDAAGFWTALEQEPFETDSRARFNTAREASAVEVWRAFVRDVRAGWKAAKTPGPEMDCAAFARWLVDAAATLEFEPPTALVGGVHVLPLEALDGRPLDFLGVAGLDAASFPRRARPSLLGDEERQAIHRRARPGCASLAGGRRGRAGPPGGSARPRPPRTCARLRWPRRRLPAPERRRRSGRRGPAAARRHRHA